ncbi:hypothetical protein ACFQ3Y_09170 [Paenibacillus motobuensis]|uniref:hypothetical protein n=1 Tax=Paenibacillus motobuensis TaxID=295324 RepID=UPI0036362528
MDEQREAVIEEIKRLADSIGCYASLVSKKPTMPPPELVEWNKENDRKWIR